MKTFNSLRKTAAATLVAAAAMLASSSASALCYTSAAAPASTVTPDASGTYAYGYTLSGVGGTCPTFFGASGYVTTTFEVPYFTDASISAITSPTGWTYSIDATDTFGLGSGAETLVWTAPAAYGIAPAAGSGPAPTLGGFGYTAAYGSVYAPAAVLIVNSSFPFFVDPALPGSPEALAAGLAPMSFPTASVVPEPSSTAALLAGLGVLALVRRRRA